MKRVFLTAAVLLAVSIVAAAETPVRLDSRGRLTTSELQFGGDCWNGRRNFGQSDKEWKTGKTEVTPIGWSSKGEIHLPGEPGGSYNAELRKNNSPDSYTYELNISSGVRYGFTFRTAMPTESFAGRVFRINGKEFVLPLQKNKGKVEVYANDKVNRLEIPEQNGVLILSGTFTVRIHDYRPRPNTYSLLIGVPRIGKTPDRKLRLNVEYRPNRSQTIDLRKFVNMGFADQTPADGKGGWTDQGPENDLRMIPVGRHRWRGVEFDIINPARNNGKSCLVLAGANRLYMPREAGGTVKTNPRGKYFYLLHAIAWGSSAPRIGTITLTYTDGTETVLNIKSGDTGNWWSPVPVNNGEVVWTGENRSSYVGLYRSVYEVEDKPLAGIRFQSAGNAVWMIAGATLCDRKVPQNASIPHYIVAGRNWKPIDYHKDILPGSVLDFSSRLDAPAGKYGPVVIRNGHFEFRDRPGKQLRFYGTNLCSRGPYTTKAWAERLADRMAAAGFNAIRLHHHDGGMTKRERTTELDPVRMDQLDYLVHCFKKKGIYITTDLYISRRLPKGEIPEYPEKLTDIAVYKALFWVLDSVYENWKTYSRNYLTHVNPYTGLAIKDDPVLISISLVNEGNIKSCWAKNEFTRTLYQTRFEEWRKAKGLAVGATPGERNAQFERFLTETYEKRYAQMKEFVRGLGVKCPLSDQNMGSTPKLSTMRAMYDYVDNHEYSSHPRFPSSSWKLPSILHQKSAIVTGPLPGSIAVSRLYGKPFTVTEFDYAKPNRFRAEGPALIGAYAGLQGWDALFQFAYSHGLENYQRNDRANNHFDLSTDVVKSLAHRIGVSLFSGSGIQPAKESFAVLLENGNGLSFDTAYIPELANLGLIARIGTIVSPAPVRLPENCRAVFNAGTAFPRFSGGIPVLNAGPKDHGILEKLLKAGLLNSRQCNPADGIFRSSGGEIEIDRKRETFRAVSPACEVLILPAGKKGTTPFLQVNNKNGRAVFAAAAADFLPLTESKRILLLHLTDSQATKAKFASPAMERLESWGTTPFLAARGEAELTLTPPPGASYRLHAVDTSGKRVAELPLKRRADGKLTVSLTVFRPSGAVFAYELERVK